MKTYFLLMILLMLAACKKEPQMLTQKFIEPCDYTIMSYQVSNVAYHDSVKPYLTKDSYITITGDSIFNVSDKLGEFLFNGTNFIYKVIEDSLILENQGQRYAYKMEELAPNSFKLALENKFFDRIDMIKPKGKRRKIEKTVNLEY